MAEERVQRRLAAILVADVVGYSRLMEADEEGTRARLRSLHSELIDPRIAADGGRIVKTMGDGILVEFPSAVDAVRSALVIQEALRRRNADVFEEARVDFRVGINVGDVIVEGEDIHGDGVNVASRLEGLCGPGEVYVSGTVYDQAAGKLAASFEDLGEKSVKNIEKPVRVYRARVEPNADARPEQHTEHTLPPLLEKPSIAVLPFDNLSGDPEQEYFADGLAEDIITGLSRFHWFFVIARNSSFTYKGGAVDLKQVARELGVQYVLEGSVRKAGNRVRVTAQLIDALTNRHVWAERYDRDLEDIFVIQDELTEAIVGAVAPSFISAEAKKVERKSPENFDAWDYAMRGNWYLSHRGKDNLAEARRLFDKALELDSRSTMALSGLALTLTWMLTFGWAGDADEILTTAYEAARRAVELDENNAEAHVALGWVSVRMHKLDSAVAACRHALELNPSLAIAEGVLAIVLSWRGDDDEAILHAEKAERLSPRDPIYSLWSFAHTVAEFGAGRYEQAVEWANKTIEATPEFPGAWRYLAAGLAHLGRIEEACAAIDQVLHLVPHDNIRLLRKILPSVRPERLERFLDGLRKAGLPE